MQTFLPSGKKNINFTNRHLNTCPDDFSHLHAYIVYSAFRNLKEEKRSYLRTTELKIRVFIYVPPKTLCMLGNFLHSLWANVMFLWGTQGSAKGERKSFTSEVPWRNAKFCEQIQSFSSKSKQHWNTNLSHILFTILFTIFIMSL